MNRPSLVVGRWLFVAGAGFVVLGAALTAQTAPAPAPVMKAVATGRQLHDVMIIPASNALFALERQAPKDNAGWAAAKRQALVLSESGNLLMLGMRVRDKGQWLKLSRRLVDTAEAAIKALDAQSMDDVVIANGEVLEVCQDCHTTYRDKGRSMR